MRGGTDIVGYIASGFVLLTFMTKEMRLLRIMAILSNLAFIAYGLLDEILPVLALHVVLLPLNVFRLSQLELSKAQGRSRMLIARRSDHRAGIGVGDQDDG